MPTDLTLGRGPFYAALLTVSRVDEVCFKDASEDPFYRNLQRQGSYALVQQQGNHADRMLRHASLWQEIGDGPLPEDAIAYGGGATVFVFRDRATAAAFLRGHRS